ncbi:MAG: hypothetical protein SFY96_03425 [Planctomycetota bacterium]|nr:hypothetical protein [Planctomycetota bacterium]
MVRVSSCLAAGVAACAMVAAAGLPTIGLAAAQPAPEAKQPGASDAQRVPPQIQLYSRVETVRRQVPVVPLLVVVKDAESFVQAIGRWSLQGRFPVLIDDEGSVRSHENIGRFARAFKPQKVLRWTCDAPGSKANAAVIDNAIARAFGAKGTKEPVTAEPRADLKAVFKAVNLTPPGIVVANPEDPAWVGGVALAAAHGQPMVWLNKLPRSVDDTFSRAQFATVDRQIEEAAQATGYSWSAQGDELESVTLACNLPLTTEGDASGALTATTDLIGRNGSSRWAWAGQLSGGAGQSAYMAMCSIFLQPTDAFLFDGYENAKDFAKYDCTAAGKVLSQAGFRTTVMDEPGNSDRDWRGRMAKGGLLADLVLVNTMGNKEFFQLRGGTCRAGDVPFLTRPAAVHFIHSWSARYVAARETVGGRWLERGAYLYYGSTQEPYLAAFHPTPTVATRLSAAPFAAAVRLDGGPAWKLAVLGDPLASFGPPAPKSEDLPIVELRFSGATFLDEVLPAATANKSVADVLVILTDMGRDEEAAALASSLLKDNPSSVTPSVAANSILPLFRAAKFADMVMMYTKLSPKDAENGMFRDALWFAAYATPREMIGGTTLGLLRENVRPDQLERDAGELAVMWGASKGSAQAVAMLQQLRDAQPDAQRKGDVEKALASYKSRPAR